MTRSCFQISYLISYKFDGIVQGDKKKKENKMVQADVWLFKHFSDHRNEWFSMRVRNGQQCPMVFEPRNVNLHGGTDRARVDGTSINEGNHETDRLFGIIDIQMIFLCSIASVPRNRNFCVQFSFIQARDLCWLLTNDRWFLVSHYSSQTLEICKSKQLWPSPFFQTLPRILFV